MRNPKILIVMLGLIIILVLILLLRFLNKPITPAERPKPTAGLTQSPIIEELVILNTSANQEVFVTQPITLTFNKPVKTASVVAQSTPGVNLKITNSDKLDEISIIPESIIWKYNTGYTITIMEAEAYDGKKLNKEFEIKFQTLPYSGI